MKQTLLFFTIISFMLCSGCMSFRGSEFNDSSQGYPEKVSQITHSDLRVQSVVNARHYANGVVATSSSEANNRYIKILEKMLSDQHMFGEIGLSVSDPDWSIKIDIREEEKFNEINVILSGCTLLLIPCTDDIEISANATVYDKNGKELAILKSKQNFKYVLQTFLLFAAPWRNVVSDEAQENLIKDIILQLGELTNQKG